MSKEIETTIQIAIFEGKRIRRHYDEDKELWYFSVIDIVAVLTDQKDFQLARNYWKVLKNRLKKEGSEVVTKCNRLKMEAEDGKLRETDVVDTEVVLRLIQSIPSPNAEPFKLWLARVGYERLEETADPELGINRALKTYLQKGYSPEWINQRLKSIEIRKALTDEWGNRGMKEGLEYAILTDEITQAWAGLTTKQYKSLKNLKKESLRDNMTNLELVLNMLAETATTEISQKQKPSDLEQNKKVARQGGDIAGGARKKLEKRLGRSVVNKANFLPTKKRIKKIK
mgnify:CR=1 FL=1